MANVKSVTQREKGALIHLEDPSAKPIWTPEYELAVQLIGKPIPNDWTQKEGNYGPQALPPKKGGGGGVAWKNTKEGFEAESESIRRHQLYEEEKRDRRTALMQAIQYAATVNTEPNGPYPLLTADEFYAWLRSSPALRGQEVTNMAQEVIGAAPGPSGTEPGEVDDTGKVASSGSTQSFPMKPENCNHRFGSGNWLTPITIAGTDHCPRCGMKTVLYRESDVGP